MEGDSPEHACFLVTSSLADGKPLFAGTLEIQRITYQYIYLDWVESNYCDFNIYPRAQLRGEEKVTKCVRVY